MYPSFSKFSVPVAITLFIWSLIIFFPGSYSIDSWEIFDEVTSGAFRDWHSPVTALTWKILYTVTGKFFVIYVVQMLFYWYLIYLLFRDVKNLITFTLTLSLALFFLFMPQYVMKDVHLGLAWGIAFCLMIPAGQKPGRFRLIIIPALLAYGFFIRPNVIIALLPLLLLFIELYFPGIKRSGHRIIIVFLAAGMLAAGYFLLTYAMLNAEKTYPEYKLMFQDVAGITKSSGHNYIPACISDHEDYQHDSVMTLYHPASFDHIYWPDEGRILVPAVNGELNSCLKNSWRHAVISEPLTYLKNRFEGFLYYLRIKKRFSEDEYWNTALWVDPHNPYELERDYNAFTGFFERLWNRFNGTVVYAPWIWVLLNMLLFIYFSRKYHRRGRQLRYKLHASIQLTAILYTLSQFPVFQHDRDFRYHYLNVIIFLIGLSYATGKSTGIRRFLPQYIQVPKISKHFQRGKKT